MLNILRLGGGLLLLIASNIAIGSIKAIINKEWSWKTFLNGVIKGVIVVGAFCAVYFAGWLNPDLVVIELNGQTMNLEMAVYVVLLAGFTYYAVKVIAKLKNIVTSKSSGETEESNAITNTAEQIEQKENQ